MIRARHKFNAKAVTVDGHKFPSKAEARRYGELKMLERADAIRNLELQPAFDLRVEGMKVCSYVADFAYFEQSKRVIEDVKGVRTPVYRLKIKLLKALYPGIDHREVE